MELKELLEKVLASEGLTGLKIVEVKESRCTKPGDNYMSVVSIAEVRGMLPGEELYSKRFFIKRPMANKELGEMFRVQEAFQNEATAYLKLFPLYDVTVPCPHCYYADDDVIILEDLGAAGYTMGKRHEGFDLTTSIQIVKAMAKFHAGSYQAIFVKKDDFTKFASLLKLIGLNISGNAAMLEALVPRIQSQVDENPDTKLMLDFLKLLDGKVFETLKRMREVGKIEVLSHGDFWINNIMTRPEEKDPVRFVDLQACALTSPAMDIWVFLYTSLELSVMDGHIQQLLQTYCDSFIRELNSLKLPKESIPSLSDLMEDLTSRELYGFLLAYLYLPAVSLSSESMPDFESATKDDVMSDFILKAMQYSGYKERVGTLISVSTARGLFNRTFQSSIQITSTNGLNNDKESENNNGDLVSI